MPEEKKAKAVSQVVASEAMVPPRARKVFERRPYVTLPDAPATHARLCVLAEGGNAFCLQFNGADLITMRFPDGVCPNLRAHSDGDFQSQPFIQQFQMSLDEEAEVEVNHQNEREDAKHQLAGSIMSAVVGCQSQWDGEEHEIEDGEAYHDVAKHLAYFVLLEQNAALLR